MHVPAVALIVLATAAIVSAQSGNVERPTFDVASVKTNTSDEGVIRFAIQPGG